MGMHARIIILHEPPPQKQAGQVFASINWHAMKLKWPRVRVPGPEGPLITASSPHSVSGPSHTANNLGQADEAEDDFFLSGTKRSPRKGDDIIQ